MENRRFKFNAVFLCILIIATGIIAILFNLGDKAYADAPPSGVTIETPDNIHYSYICANGHAIIITDADGDANTTNDTCIYLDTNSNGIVDIGESSCDLGLSGGDAINGYDLSTYNIFGGSRSGVVTNTKITMLGGKISGIHGGGLKTTVENDTNITINNGTIGVIYGGGSILDGAGAPVQVKNDTNITINGGIIGSIIGSGHFRGSVDGSTNIIVNGGTVDNYIYGGGLVSGADVGGDTNITITGGTVKGDVYGGGNNCVVSGTAHVKIYADASVLGSISSGGSNLSSVGIGSYAECEVAFYDTKNGTKYTAGDYATQWINIGGTATKPTDPIPTVSTQAFDSWKKFSDDSSFAFTTAITGPIKLYPTFTDKITINGTDIYANGNAITLKAGATSDKTFIYLDSDHSTPIPLTGPVGDINNGYDLSGYSIYGGKILGIVSSTKITMQGGETYAVYGSGWACSVNGDTNVTISGGTIYYVYGGGYSNDNVYGNTNVTISGGTICDVYGGSLQGSVTGNTNVTISGGRISRWVFGGGHYDTVNGNTNVTISGGIISGNIYGGVDNGSVIGTAHVKIYADASFPGNISAGCESTGTVGSGSYAECEVAFYNGTTKLSNPAPQWIKVWENGSTSSNTATEPATPTSAGKIFNGWKKSNGSAYNFSTVITKPIKLYASWTAIAIPTYTVIYNPNGATSGTVPTDVNTYANGANVPLKGNTGNLTKTGYTFGGWATTANGTAVASYTMGAGNVNFYAVWTANTSSDSSSGGASGSSGSSGSTPNTPKKEPFLKGSTGTVISELKKAEAGDVIKIDMNGSTTLQSEWLESIAGKDVNIVLDMGNGVTWTINGTSITGKNFSDIDLAVTTETNKIPVTVINNISGESKVMQFTVTHSGEFGFTATLSIGLGNDNAGLYANLFYYNETTKALEFIGVCKIGKDGSAEWDLEHTSTYAVIIDRVSLAPEDVSAGTGKEAEEALISSETANSENNVIAFFALILILGGGFAVNKKSKFN